MDWAGILAYYAQVRWIRNCCRAMSILSRRIASSDTQLKGRLLLSDGERATLGEIGHRLGRKALADIATVAKPDTILGWYRRLVAAKFDGSKQRRYPGRPRVERELEAVGGTNGPRESRLGLRPHCRCSE